MRTPRRILIIKPSSLGDIVQALPVLAALHDAYPRARIGWVVRDVYASFLAAHPLLDVVIPFARRPGRFGNLVADQLRLAMRLNHFNPDLAIDLQGLARSAWFCWLSRAARRIGMSDARELARLAYTEVASVGHRLPHAVDRYMQVVRQLTGRVPPVRFVLPRTPNAAAWAERLVRRLGGPPIVVAPGARWYTKQWPAECFGRLIRELSGRGCGPFVLVGASAEQHVAARVGAAAAVLDLVGRTDLLMLTELLRRARLFIGNDSGPAHLAAAAGCPTVVLFTCTSPHRAVPRGAPVRVVQATVPCVASYRKRCSHLSCHATITVDRVVRAAYELLRSTATLHRQSA